MTVGPSTTAAIEARPRLALRPLSIALACAVLAIVLHVRAVGNGYTMDDVPIVRENPASHSVHRATAAWLDPYWADTSGSSAGQYRPLTILTFAAEWSATGGSVAWMHATNVALHGVVTGLAVLVLSAWLQGLGLWVAGVIFAVHPVHVEAVAGLVGRAELIAAAALLLAVLMGRRYRSSTAARERTAWLLGVSIVVLLGLFAKEHAVVAVALIALDHMLTDRRSLRYTAQLYVTVTAVTVAWLHVFRGVASAYVEGSQAALFRGLSDGQRVVTMLPVQLDVVRLLVWPFDLVADYNPQVIIQRHSLDWVGVLGAITAVAVLALGVALVRRAPAITFGIFAGAMTYAPTSNLLFASGVSLAERNLYLAVLATSATLGVIATSVRVWHLRRWVLIGIGILAVAYGIRTVERVPVWEDTWNVVIHDIVSHPENYRTRLRLASFLVNSGDSAAALAEEMAAVRLFPRDPFTAPRTVPRSLALGLTSLAIAEAQRAHHLSPDHPILAELLVDAFLAAGHVDSALTVARQAIVLAPRSNLPILAYDRVLDILGAPQWRRSVNQARLHFAYGRFGQATSVLRTEVLGDARTHQDPEADCWEAEQLKTLINALSLEGEMPVDHEAESCGPLVSEAAAR